MSKELKHGEPCEHPGCLSHVSHPCEGCGRIAGRPAPTPEVKEQVCDCEIQPCKLHAPEVDVEKEKHEKT